MELRSKGNKSEATGGIDAMSSSTAAAGTSGGVPPTERKSTPMTKKSSDLMKRLERNATERAEAKAKYRAMLKRKRDDGNPSVSASEEVDGNENADQSTSQATKTNPMVATAEAKRKEKCTHQENEVFNKALLPPRLFCTDRYPTRGRINSYSRSDFLLELVEAIDDSELEWLKASCFGSLFHLPVRKSALSGKLVHQFLCRSLVTRKPEEMWFVFGGHPIRFSLREFGILTGLNCAPYPCEETLDHMKNPPDEEEQVNEEIVDGTEKTLAAKKKRYYNSLIGPKKTYSIQYVVALLKMDLMKPPEERMDVERRRRLALIVIVDGVVACNTSSVKATYGTAYMTKNLDTFIKFPWGRLSFERAIEMVNAAGKKVESVDKLVEKFSQSHTANHGFTLAFQLLFMKAIPALEKFLPEIDDEVTFSDRSVQQLTMLKTFHNSNILETELSPSLAVESIISGDGDRDMQDYSWGDDETEDVAVEYMFRFIKAGHIFKKEDWHGGVDHLEPITSCLNRQHRAKKGGAKLTAEQKGKGKCIPDMKAEPTGNDDGESSKIPGDSVNGEELLREIDRRNQEHTLAIQHMLSVEMNAMRLMRDEVKKLVTASGLIDNTSLKDLMNEVNKQSPSSRGGGSNQGGGNGEKNIYAVSTDDDEDSDPDDDEEVHIDVDSNDGEDSDETDREDGHDGVEKGGVEDGADEAGVDDKDGVDANDGVEKNETDENVRDGVDNKIDDVDESEEVKLTSGGGNDETVGADGDGQKSRQLPSSTEESTVAQQSRRKRVRFALDDVGTTTTMLEKRAIKKPKRYGDGSSFIKGKAPAVEGASDANMDIPFRPVHAALRTKFLRKLAEYDRKVYMIDGHRMKANFFEKLHKPRNWVESPHMEAMLNLLWRRLGDHLLKSRVGLLDPWFGQALADEFARHEKCKKKKVAFKFKKLINNYVSGTVPGRMQKLGWYTDVYTIYVPLNWGRRHWVAVVIYLKLGKVVILDPLIESNDDSKLPRLMKPVVEMLPMIIREYAETDGNFPGSFSFERLGNVYQNKRTGDCGPLTVKYIELHALGIEMDDLTDKKVDEMRMRIAIDVYEKFVATVD